MRALLFVQTSLSSIARKVANKSSSQKLCDAISTQI